MSFWQTGKLYLMFISDTMWEQSICECYMSRNNPENLKSKKVQSTEETKLYQLKHPSLSWFGEWNIWRWFCEDIYGFFILHFYSLIPKSCECNVSCDDDAALIHPIQANCITITLTITITIPIVMMMLTIIVLSRLLLQLLNNY